MTSPRLVALSLAAAAAVAGCKADLSVPPGGEITCASGTCPDGWTCNVKLGRCIWNPDIDTVAPTVVGTVTVSPLVARAGALATVAFDVSEALRSDPVVTVEAGFARPLTLVSKSGRHYVYGYYVTGTEPQAGCPVTIRLEDRQALEGTAGGGAVTFDFTPPRVVAASLAGSPVSLGQQLTLDLTVSEPLAEAPRIRLAGGAPFAFDSTDGAGRYVYHYASTGLLPDEAEGAPGQAVLVDLTDVAGNAAAGLPAGAAVFDRTPPRLAGAAQVTPLAARDGSDVVLTFTVDEPLGGDPEVLLSFTTGAGAPILLGQVTPQPDPRTYVFHHVAEKTEGEGGRTFWITLSDPAGNRAVVAGPSVGFYFTEPAVEALATCRDDGTDAPCVAPQTTFSAQAGMNLLKISFHLQVPARTLEVALGAETLTPTLSGPGTCTSDPGGLDWICRKTVQASASGGTTDTLTVTAVDVAGNVASPTTQVFYDFLPPTLGLGGAIRERCDDYGPAKRNGSAYWLQPLAAMGCTYPASGCGAVGPVRVVFDVSEDLGTAGAAKLADVYLRPSGSQSTAGGADTIALAVASCLGGPAGVVAYLTQDPSIDRQYELLGEVVDAYGNRSPPMLLGAFQRVSTAPPAPSTGLPGFVTYSRAPFGPDAATTAARHAVDGGAGSASATTAIQTYSAVVLDGPAAGGTPRGCVVGGATIPRATTDATGAFSCVLPAAASAPPVELWVAQEDSAGNRSPAALVRDGSWLAKPSAGNRLAVLATLAPARDAAGWTPAGLPAVTAGAVRFDPAGAVTSAPFQRGYCAAAYVPERGEVLMMGGESTLGGVTSYREIAWTFDGKGWSGVASGTLPPRRASAGLAHDPVRERTVLFGGTDGTTRSDQWERGPSGWQQVCAASPCSDTKPAATRGHALFYDATLGKVVMFGGRAGGAAQDGMYAWDGAAWAELSPATRPGKRAWPLFATRPSDGTTLLASGTNDREGDADSDPNAVWEWRAGSWLKHPRPAGQPTPDLDYRAAELFWDGADQAFYLYRPAENDLYVWDGTWFTTTGVPQPGVTGELARLRRSAQAPCGAWHEALGAFVRFGGCAAATCAEGTEARADTFAFANGAWHQLDPAPAPPARSAAAAAFDGAAGAAFAWGGLGAGGAALADAWRWDGLAWTSLTVAGAGLHGAALAQWGAQGPLVRLGGAEAGPPATTALLDPGASAWVLGCGTTSCGAGTYLEPVGAVTSHDPGEDQALAYLEPAGLAPQLLFFRGRSAIAPPDPVYGATGSTTWIATVASAATDPALDRVTWAPVDDSAGAPESLSGHRLTACATRVNPGAVLFGGSGPGGLLARTWVWDGATWTDRSPGLAPPARALHVQVCDPASGTVLVFGGLGDAGLLDDVWQWDGAAWTDRTPPARPAARSGAAFAPAGDRGAVVFGGRDGAGVLGDTFSLDAGASARPAHLFAVALAGAGVPPARVSSLDVRWSGGASGTSPATGLPLDGVQLHAWTAGAWRPVGTPSGAGAAGGGEAAWAPAGDLTAWFAGDARELTLLAAPRGANGAGAAVLRTEVPRVLARYRLCLAAGRSAALAVDCCSGGLTPPAVAGLLGVCQ